MKEAAKGMPVFTQDGLALIHVAMELHRIKAVDSLGRYKFEMFGYHASAWVRFARLCACGHPNPFSDLVKAARSKKAKL